MQWLNRCVCQVRMPNGRTRRITVSGCGCGKNKDCAECCAETDITRIINLGSSLSVGKEVSGGSQRR